MPDGWNRWLTTLGSLLPQQLRERVFDPACYDLVRDTLERRRSHRLLAPRLVAILLYTAVANFPQALIERRRPSRLALVLGGGLLLTVLVLVSLALAMRHSYT